MGVGKSPSTDLRPNCNGAIAWAALIVRGGGSPLTLGFDTCTPGILDLEQVPHMAGRCIASLGVHSRHKTISSEI